MSSGQGADIGDKNFKHFRKSRNKKTKEKRKGEGPLLKVHHLTII